MSECSTFISGAPSRPAAPGTLGYAQPGRRIAILDAAGQPVARGTPGTLAIAADDPGLMLEYLGAPEANAARRSGKWFLTGDTAAMAEDGAVSYLGRNDDIMNAGGYRVSPVEVEHVMVHHPGVLEAACAEVQVSESATVIGCFYVPQGAAVSDKDLSFHAHNQLAHYKCPRVFVPVTELPRGANGKLLRRTLPASYEAG